MSQTPQQTPHPTSDYRVKLEAYAGPLDLLLYLVKRHEIDLHDIPVAELTDQYLRHLEVIRTIDVDRAGEFLVMAATLLEIKSRLIMPPVEAGEGEEDQGEQETLEETDPRFELVQQLLAYKRYKDAAIELELRHDEWVQRFAATPKKRAKDQLEEGEAEQLDLDLEDVHVMDLCEAFARVLESIGNTPRHEVTYDDTPLSLHATDIRDRLQREGPMTLKQMFAGRSNRSEMIGLFLATLELVRDREVTVQQDEATGDVMLTLLPEIPEEDQDAAPSALPEDTDDHTGYDWPDPEALERAKERSRRRSNRLAKLRSGEALDADDEEDTVDLETDSVDAMLGEIDNMLDAVNRPRNQKEPDDTPDL